ncbi:hypothetical protein SK128_018705 [Halocaridina rubra]|uniref:G-protein coupled receptors family 1 profile domain-containing protein n=1 Tax=Halocaridina rubra TaxID=373956 RepID=A0AAN8XFA7_HALRR
MAVEEAAPDWALVLTAISAIVISILGFFGNLLTILALPYSNRLRNAATWFVVNLAVVEGLFCVTILPISGAHLFSLYMRDQSLFSNEGCSVFVFLRYVAINAEVFSIAAIAVNRCLLIAFPRKYPSIFTTAKTIATIIMIWVISAALMIIPLSKLYGEFTYNERTKECDFSDNPESGGAGPRKLFLALGFLLPCVVIILSYSYIFYKAKRSSARIRARSQGSLMKEDTINSMEKKPSRPAEGLRKRDLRIARTIGVIFLTFLLCCTPVSIAHYLDNKYHNLTLLLLLHPLYWAQYCINILIYVFMNNQYRDAYVNYISRFWPNFKEVTITKFKWREEGTSYESQRQTRAATPNSIVRFATRKLSKSSSFKGGLGQSANAVDNNKVHLNQQIPEEKDSPV